MSLSMILQCTGLTVTGTLLETKYVSKTKSSPGNISHLFALTPAVLIATGFWMTSYGFTVGAARRKAIEQAKKDGEKDVTERYDFPNLYAQGTSKNAKDFNCVQRSHQHMLETYTQVVVTGIMGAISYPITTTASSLLYFAGRYVWAKGYATGEPKDRYQHPLAKYMWYGLLINHMAGIISCVNIVIGKKLL
mmetsp:Transcript_24758/g.36646  ORF Transcript_24758/g.36646 Transcript_24758/m.36646 type:complete len:192 (+) Transcript_24758:148-723(+)|eukprot:CAMPEP_0194200156 /NCGR_PEP_ID=MMETSP0156-20130528/889_1 /TAXON_ID=33649 /ORGANISM="Thalassionema nitzschioides, Strain L26-B" /LENGTH=191 /DNA_ID=CAMNT_0038925123 /DNA_START=117 /DNA_END=692 /DNA_ORIENTATION=+